MGTVSVTMPIPMMTVMVGPMKRMLSGSILQSTPTWMVTGWATTRMPMRR
ncbi:MAG: hypothetical protein Ct9H300mP10_07570 [Methanobacteriota archaeon]|nr:MAG: hypothetical protein Ct9H300mP10_07570 [Euryarchaeota archaeon]